MRCTVALPGLPDAPEDRMPFLTDVASALVDDLEGDWTVEEEAHDDEVAVYASRRQEGLLYTLSLSGIRSVDEPPSHWTMDGGVSRPPVVTQADKWFGGIAVGLCLALGVGAGVATFWLVPWSGLGLMLAVPVAVVVIMTSLVAALYLTPKSAPAPLPEGLEEAFDRDLQAALDGLAADGRILVAEAP